MTVDANTGKSGKRYSETWDECSRCGFIYPISELVYQQGDRGGQIVCIKTCLDEPSSGDYKQNELPTEPPIPFVEC